jgi:hypothetical protein
MPSCPNCGAEVVPGNKFCVNCGASLEQAVTPPAARDQQRPAAEPVQRRARSTRSLGLIVLAAVVVAIAVVGLLVYRSSSGKSAGAASPESAVRSLAHALAAGDYVAASNTFPPDEQSGLDGAVKNVVSLMSQSGLAGKNKVGGISIRLDSVNATPLATDVEAVDVGGELKFRTHDYTSAPGTGQPLRLIAIRQFGRWYVDPLLSAWEYIATRENLPSGDYATAISGDVGGAESSEAAVNGLATAIAAKDVASAERLVAAPEARVLRVFGNAIDDLLGRTNYQATVSQLQLVANGSESVVFHGAHVDVSRSSGELRIDLNSRCADWTSDSGATREYCVLASNALRARLGIDSLALRTVKTGGGYRVDVLGSLGDLTSRVAGKLDGGTALAAAASVEPVLAAKNGKVQSIRPGARVRASTGQPYVVYAFPVTRHEAVEYSSSDDQNTGLFLEDKQGHWVNPGSLIRNGGVSDFMIAPSDGTGYLVVLSAPSSECSSSAYSRGGIPWLASGCWFGTVRNVAIGLRQIPIRSATVPGTLAAHIAPGKPAVFRVVLSGPRTVGEVQKPAPGDWFPSLFSDSDTLRFPGAPQPSSPGEWGGVFGLAPGVNWFVLEAGDKPIDATLSLTDSLLGFGVGGGKLTDTQQVTNGYGSDFFVLPPGKGANLAVSSEDGSPLYLSVSDVWGGASACDYTASGQDNPVQSCSIPPATRIRVFSIDIRSYTDFTADLVLHTS